MISICKFDEVFLEYSWLWLNEPEVKALTNSPDFTKEEQSIWYNKLNTLLNYKIWGVKFYDKPIGACGLKNITNNDCEYWGYIGDKRMWGKGYGKIIVAEMVSLAIELGLESVWLQVTKVNLRAINLYIRNGFEIEKEDGTEYIMRLRLKNNAFK